MKESINYSFDEAVNSFKGIFFWQDESDSGKPEIQYSENVMGVTGFLGSEIKELKHYDFYY